LYREPSSAARPPRGAARPEKARAVRALRVLSTVNLVAMAGIIGVTTFLNQRAASSWKWRALSAVLP